MSEWRTGPLGTFIQFQRGADITRATQTPGSVPVVSSGGISSFNGTAYSDGPGVVIGRKGTLGKAFYLPGPFWPHDTTLWVKDFKGSDPRFVYYFMSRFDVSWLDAGSANPTLNRNHLHPVVVSWPGPAEQQAIAEVLGALDDKIAANTALVSQLDALMHLTFRGLAGGDAAPLSSTAEFVNGKAFTKGASGSGRVVVRIAELNGGISGSTVHSDAIVDDKHVARPGDILFAWSGSLTLHRWYREEAIVNQHIFKVIPRAGYRTWLVYELLRDKLADFKAIAADKATTMGHIQRHHLDEEVAIPHASEVERVDALMSALWERALGAERESLTLAETRDALLPQLMSGKLRVRDAERIAVDAGL